MRLVTVNADARAKLEAVREQAAAASKLSKLVEEQRREAITAAREAGLTLTEIAQLVGLTTSRVDQILKNTR